MPIGPNLAKILFLKGLPLKSFDSVSCPEMRRMTRLESVACGQNLELQALSKLLFISKGAML
jgi:hypothetical protein